MPGPPVRKRVTVRQLEGALDTAVALDATISAEALSEAEVEAIVVPTYLRRMPDCALGDYSTDEDGRVECDYHSS